MILSAFRRGSYNRNVQNLYGTIVAQARVPAFYSRYGVSDSVEGRFELIVMHLVLVLRRLGGEPTPASRQGLAGTAAGQQLFDAFCRDLDDNLREMGVGDLAVPRRMREFGEAFYGRQAAYATALDAANEHELEKALARNIFGLAEANDSAVRLARYARAAAGQLAAAADEALLAGRVAFPRPEAFANV
jgi:cytochrome b pre-mRNA-processing protein 3